MWKTQHVATIVVAVTILSITLTLYAQSMIQNVIASEAAKLGVDTSNPIQQMSALSSTKKGEKKGKKGDGEGDSNDTFIIPPTITKHVRFEDQDHQEVDDATTVPAEKPKGAGSRWTPLKPNQVKPASLEGRRTIF